MKTINTITQKRVSFILFPDGQPHATVKDIQAGDDVELFIRLAQSTDVLHLLQISDALDTIGAKKRKLSITYLMAARYDRIIHPGDGHDLRVISKLVNSCGFESVEIFDPHSDVALALIERSKAIDNSALVKAYDQPNAMLICPDAGAVKKVEKYSYWNPKITDVLYCNKTRHLATGAVTLKLNDPEADTLGRHCVVIDDICDGGATFLAIARQVIRPASLTLIVSHGIFSKGLRQLKEAYNEIITTDSYQHQNPESQFRVIRLYDNEPTTTN